MMFGWLKRTKAPPATAPALPPHEPLGAQPLVISQATLEFLAANPDTAQRRARNPFVGVPKPPPGVIPEGHKAASGMAMDSAVSPSSGGTWGAWATSGLWGEGLFFPGYPYLAELSQRPEYRHIAETYTQQMTRKWIKLNAKGDDDLSDKIEKLENACIRYDMRGTFHRAFMLDCLMGMGLIYLDIDGVRDDPEELKSPLLRDDAGLLKAEKIPKGSLKGFVVVDPTWVSPLMYNSIDPLRPDFFVPATWYVMGKVVDATRLLIVRARPMPDILKSSYNFGGMSLSQMAKRYVDNWLRTQQSVSDLLHAFTTFVLKTNLNALLADAGQMIARVTAFIFGRDNKGLMMVDKETEEFDNVSAPLGTLDHLQAQAQEQMASVTQIPLIWLLGISPTGLNATAEPEIRVFYDRVLALKEQVARPIITTMLQVIQLSEFGSIDPNIDFTFEALWELDEAGRAATQKVQADTAAVYIDAGVVSQEEERDRLAADATSPYHGLEGPPPEPPDMGDDPALRDDADKIAGQGAAGSESGANSGV